MKASHITGAVGNFLTDTIAVTSYGVHKGMGKLGKDITLDTAQKVGTGIVGGATVLGTASLAMNIDEGIGPAVGHTVQGMGLGAIGGGAAGVALAIAKGIR